MAEVVSLADRINVTEQSDAPERPPKITQAEADYQLARGPYAARLAAARRTLEIAMRFSDEENASLFPVGYVQNLEAVVATRQSELKNFEIADLPVQIGTPNQRIDGDEKAEFIGSLPAEEVSVNRSIQLAQTAVTEYIRTPIAKSMNLSRQTPDDDNVTTAQLEPIDKIGVRYDEATHSELILIDEPEGSWQDRALCAQTSPEEFFPDKGGRTREAKKVCLACEVRDDCLEYALVNDERFGIWGGLSERERRKLKKRNAASKSA